MVATFLVREWFVPREAGPIDVWLILAWMLIAPAACVVYSRGQRRDRQLTARLQEELGRLNEPDLPTKSDGAGSALGPESVQTCGSGFGFAEFKAEELQNATHPSRMSLEGVLTVVLVLFFVAAMVSILVPMRYDFWIWIVAGFGAVAVCAMVGYIVHRVAVWLNARSIDCETKRPS